MLLFLELEFAVFVLLHLVKRLLGQFLFLVDGTSIAIAACPAFVRWRFDGKPVYHVTVLTPGHRIDMGFE